MFDRWVVCDPEQPFDVLFPASLGLTSTEVDAVLKAWLTGAAAAPRWSMPSGEVLAIDWPSLTSGTWVEGRRPRKPPILAVSVPLSALDGVVR